jgi:hypothetical protein
VHRKCDRWPESQIRVVSCFVVSDIDVMRSSVWLIKNELRLYTHDYVREPTHTRALHLSVEPVSGGQQKQESPWNVYRPIHVSVKEGPPVTAYILERHTIIECIAFSAKFEGDVSKTYISSTHNY